MQTKEVELRVLFTGDAYVGKTTLIAWSTCRSLDEFVVNYSQKAFHIGDQMVQGQLWDLVFGTEKSQRYNIKRNSLYRESHALCLCFNLNDRQSFQMMRALHSQLEYHQVKCPMFFVGCKADLEHKVTKEKIKELSVNTGMPYLQTSAKDDTGVTESIQKVMEAAYEFYQKKQNGKLKLVEKPIQKKPGYCKS